MHFSVTDAKTRSGLERIINVWEERSVYDSTVIGGLRAAMKVESTPITTVKKSEPHIEKPKRKPSEKKTKSFGKLIKKYCCNFFVEIFFINFSLFYV